VVFFDSLLVISESYFAHPNLPLNNVENLFMLPPQHSQSTALLQRQLFRHFAHLMHRLNLALNFETELAPIHRLDIVELT